MRIAIHCLVNTFSFFINKFEAMRIFAVFLCVAAITGCRLQETSGRQVFDGEKALEQVELQLQFGNRVPGSQAHRDTGNWIIAELEANGWSVEEQVFNYRGVDIRNIIARDGSVNLQESDYTILAAHYDTRAFADRDPEDPLAGMPGANDGASGVAVLLELSRVLSEAVRKEILLVFFDAEDQFAIADWEALVGSKYFVDQLAHQPRAMVLLDMIGDQDLQLYYEQTSTRELKEQIWAIAADLGYQEFIPEDKYSIIDDHTPFLRAGIPAVVIIDFDYPYWHTSEDTFDKVSARSLSMVGIVIQTWVETLHEPIGP
jgi:Zn-dependent M28 family amino/carboxypeptidase